MNIYTRIGTYLFIVGSLLVLFASVFPFDSEILPFVYGALVFTGVFSGLMNITDDEEAHFMASATVFLITLIALDKFTATLLPFGMTNFSQSASLFVGSMVLVVAVRNIIEMGSRNNQSTTLEHEEHTRQRLERDSLAPARRSWQFIVFLAVALTFVLLLVDVFAINQFPPDVQRAVLVLDWLVILIFVVDVIILYRDPENKGAFVKRCWPDIVAAIPVPISVFQLLKVVRILRITRVARASQLVKVSNAKFFNGASGIDHYLHTPLHDGHQRFHTPHGHSDVDRHVSSLESPAAVESPMLQPGDTPHPPLPELPLIHEESVEKPRPAKPARKKPAKQSTTRRKAARRASHNS